VQEKTMRKIFNGRLVFFSEFLRHPRQVQSVTPSSRFLRARIVQASRVSSARVVVELGPGTGETTRALLEAMPAHSRLLSIEINELFHSVVSRIDDGRHIAHLGSAEKLEGIIAAYGLDAPDAIVSGIPFSAMGRERGARIVQAVATQLASNGRFVAYQVRDRVATLCRSCLSSGRRETELLNIPPMRVFQWHKREAGSAGRGVPSGGRPH
jgi:phosphatidylethanolamine/phosphatidyl-N-methylethanolamine N-methyltransferase